MQENPKCGAGRYTKCPHPHPQAKVTFTDDPASLSAFLPPALVSCPSSQPFLRSGHYPNPLNYSSLASLRDNHSLEHEGEMTPKLRIYRVYREQGFSGKLYFTDPQGLGVTALQLRLSCWPKRQPRQEVGNLRRPDQTH